MQTMVQRPGSVATAGTCRPPVLPFLSRRQHQLQYRLRSSATVPQMVVIQAVQPTNRCQHQSQRRRMACKSSQEPLSPAPEDSDFDLLSNLVADLTPKVIEDLKGCSIWLVGMMGSGKSTLGKMLANTLQYKYFDTDALIEATHDMKPVATIFAESGVEYFRSCESQVIQQLAPYKTLVVATGGGAVLNTQNWGAMHSGITVWLDGDVSLLARRVAQDGVEKRPLLADDSDNSSSSAASSSNSTSSGEPAADEAARVYNRAVVKLEALLAERKKFYENADIVVPLQGFGEDEQKGAPTAVVMYRLLTRLVQRIADTKKEREAQRQFTIEGADSLKTMRTIDSPAAVAQAKKVADASTQHVVQQEQ